jgi:hypothetical protein
MLSEGAEPSQAQRAILALGEAGKEVAAEVRADRVARKRHDRTVLALLVVVALALVGVGVVGWQNRELNAQVQDCTTPGGECFEANRKQNAANRSALTLANLAIVECAIGGAAGAALRECVERELVAAGVDISLLDRPAVPVAPAPSSVPAGPPDDATIAPPASDQPVEPSPVQPPTTETPPGDPADEGGTTS